MTLDDTGCETAGAAATVGDGCTTAGVAGAAAGVVWSCSMDLSMFEAFGAVLSPEANEAIFGLHTKIGRG